MKKIGGIVLVLLLFGLVFASGCLGGGSTTSTSPSTSKGGSSTTPSSVSSTGAGQTTSPTQTSTGASSETTTSYTTTTTSGTTGTSGGTTTSQSTTGTVTTTTTTTTATTTTSTAQKVYWSSPWEYSPVQVGSNVYNVTYYKIRYKVQPNQSAPVYEYIVEKSFGKSRVHVYGMDIYGSKVDLGEHEVYEYRSVVTPVKAKTMNGTLVLKVWYKKSVEDAFIYPWDVEWASYISPSGSPNANNFVGLEIDYGDRNFTLLNGAAFRSGLFPYFEGDGKLMSDLGGDLSNLYLGLFAVVHLTIWDSFKSRNVFEPQSGSVTDNSGHTITWSSEPDGTVTFSGIPFDLVQFDWKYSGVPEGTSITGGGKFSPSLFLPVEVSGHVTYRDSKTGKSTTVYGYIKLEDLKLEKSG